MLMDGARSEFFSPAQDDAPRQRIVGMVLFVYVLLITEGVLRKWIFPEFGSVLFFIRDPFVLAIYAMAIASGRWPSSSPWLSFALALALLSSVLAVLQVALGLGNPQAPVVFAAYGLRNYFFYIPLAFVIAETFRADDLRRMAVITFCLLVPSAVLVILQFYSPVDAVINVGSSDNPLLQFRGLGLDDQHTRPMGFFTSDAGQRQLIVSSLALVFATWGGSFVRWGALRLLLPLATLSVLVCLAFSGSRGAVLAAGLVVIAATVATIRVGTDIGRGRMVFALTCFSVLAVVVVPLLFSDGLAAFLARWSSAQAYESTRVAGGVFGRTLYGFVDFVRFLGGTPLVGYGIGMGGNAGVQLAMASGSNGPAYSAETDWARHIVDLGPILGLLFMTFRIAFVWHLLRRVLASRSTLALLLFGYLAFELLTGQITGQGSINGYAWLFTGFVLAAATAGNGSATPVAAEKPGKDPFPNLMR